jgi:outer membrane protein OmpA-like peptidoglycan-associated protein
MIIWQRSRQYLVFGVLMVASMMGVGCGAKQPPATLESARTAYTQAEQEPQVTAHAPAALQEAKRTLDRAENVWAKDRDETEVAHLAYLTEQQVEIAEAVSERERAEAEQQTLSQERETILREARAREAELARIEAERAQREAEQAQLRVENLQQQLGELQAKTTTTERGTILTLDSVLFETNKATLKSGALENLYPLVTFLRENPERTIMIEGHTDSTGDENYNLELSQQRAESVGEFLMQNGIEPNRIMARGYGETSPVAPNDTAAGRQQNRRVELVFPN